MPEWKKIKTTDRITKTEISLEYPQEATLSWEQVAVMIDGGEQWMYHYLMAGRRTHVMWAAGSGSKAGMIGVGILPTNGGRPIHYPDIPDGDLRTGRFVRIIPGAKLSLQLMA